MNDSYLWNSLARKNWKFYIYTDEGREISDEDFWKSGEKAYKDLVFDDEIITSHFPNKKDCRALEIGCGVGRILVPMSKDFGSVVGIDVSSEMVKLGKEMTQLELLETPGDTIPLSDNSVDFVLSYLVFQHIKSYVIVEDYFKEVYRVLKPGGVFKVLLRSENQRKDKWYRTKMAWWNGVHFKGHMVDHLVRRFKYKELKREDFDGGRVWLWIEK